MSSKGASARKAPSRAEEKLRAFHEEDAVTKVYDSRLFARLWPFAKPHAPFFAISLALKVVLIALNLVRPLQMGHIVAAAAAADPDDVFKQGLILTGLVISVQVVTFAHIYTMQLAGARTMSDLRAAIFDFLQRLSMRYFDKTPVGRLVTRATNDVDALGELFSSGAISAFLDLVSLVGIVIMMLRLNWRLALIAFAALPVVLLIVGFMRTRSRQANRDIRTKTARLNAFLNEQVNGIAVVQAYAREAAMAAEFDDINITYRDANKRSIYYEAVLDASIEMVATICIASLLVFVGGSSLAAMGVTFAVVVTFVSYIKQFFEPVSVLSQSYTVLQASMTGAERIFQLLDVTDTEAASLTPSECAPDGPADEAVYFENVTFGYKPGVPVLRDVSLEANRGEKVALVGATGAGKTTVASLLLRLYEVDSGLVRVLGKDVRGQDRQALREQFSVVPQDVYLFPGTLLSNVAMSDESPDREKARQAFSRIGALEIFARRGGSKDGDDAWLDMPIDERGQNFSAGERQLIAFARAVYRDAPLLILDEATASVDSDTEARLQTALEAVMKGRTAIVIAHRLSTIRAVDRIVVFHKGRVVESGPHEELLAKGGVYARLYRLQFAKEAPGPVSAAPVVVDKSA